MKIKVLYIVKKEIALALWEIYKKSFADDPGRYPHNQVNYNRESFMEAMIDETIVKFVLMNEKPIGFAMIIDQRHPEHSPWTNFQAFINKGSTKKSFYYINVLVVDPQYQNSLVGSKIVDAIIDWTAAGKGRAFGGFDAPVEKELIARLVRSRCELKGLSVEVIGAQMYYLISPK